MFSVSPEMSAGQAGRYFDREDYYLKGGGLGSNSRWRGQGAESLGLDGTVRDGFRAVCAGRHPVTGEQLVAPKPCRDPKTGKRVRKHLAGYDGTLSAPKTVSFGFMLGVEGIKEAHDAAVTTVLEHVEEHDSFYRSPDGIRRGKMVVASFFHATSRNLDPQLHTHNLIMNIVETPEGNWKAGWNRPVFRDQKSLGLLYRQELAFELEKRGFEIVITDRSQMFFELKGFDPRLVQHFSSRRKAIERKVALWKEEKRFPGVPHGRLYEMAALETRDRKREVTREEVEGHFERGFESFGTTGVEVKRELERARDLRLGQPREEPEYSAPEVIRLAAERLIEREAVLDRARLLDQAVLISGGKHSVRELNLAVGDTPGVVRLGEDAQGREYYTTVGMRELEARNLEAIRKLERFRSVVSREELGTFLKKVEVDLGVPLTAGQTREVENELLGECPVAATEGKAGVGKTLVVKVIERFNAEVLEPQGKNHRGIDAAYTARAAQEMSAASGRPAYTIDSLENAHGRGEVGLRRLETGEPILMVMGEEIPVHPGLQVVLRVDEVSFVGAQQGGHLLRIVKELQEEGVQAKLHLIGDTRQMQAIQAGDLFRQVLALEKEGAADVAHLNEIRRQRDPELLEIARTLNREDRLPGENAGAALRALELRGEIIERERHEELVSAAVTRYQEESRRPSRDPEKAARGERQSVLLITTTNADRKELNREIREAQVRGGEIEVGKSFRVLTPAPQGITADRYREGDEVRFSGYRGEDGKMQRWGARLNTTGIVTGIDLERNRVSVSYSFTAKNRVGEKVERTVTKRLSATEMAGRTTVYREEQRNLSPGDRIVALKNDRELGVQNGALGTIRSLDESGKAVVGFGKREVTLDLDRYRHVDHAYAVTIHKSQGATVEHSIWFAPVRTREAMGKGVEGEWLPPEVTSGRASYNALNVAITRAQYGASVFTNSLEGLSREVGHLDVKTSTLYPVSGARGKTEPEVFIGEPGGKTPVRKPPPLERERQPERFGQGIQKPLERDVLAGGKVSEPLPKTVRLGRATFDRGAALGKRLDELARAGGPVRNLPDDILPKRARTIAPPGGDIVKRLGPVKEIDLDMGK